MGQEKSFRILGPLWPSLSQGWLEGPDAVLCRMRELHLVSRLNFKTPPKSHQNEYHLCQPNGSTATATRNMGRCRHPSSSRWQFQGNSCPSIWYEKLIPKTGSLPAACGDCAFPQRQQPNQQQRLNDLHQDQAHRHPQTQLRKHPADHRHFPKPRRAMARPLQE